MALVYSQPRGGGDRIEAAQVELLVNQQVDDELRRRSNQRTVEDDMEDLISIPVVQALQPKRSKPDMANYKSFLPNRSNSSLSNYDSWANSSSPADNTRAFSTPSPSPSSSSETTPYVPTGLVASLPSSSSSQLPQTTAPTIKPLAPSNIPRPLPRTSTSSSITGPNLNNTVITPLRSTSRSRSTSPETPRKPSSSSPPSSLPTVSASGSQKRRPRPSNPTTPSATSSKPFPSSSSTSTTPTPSPTPRQRAQTSNLGRPRPKSTLASSHPLPSSASANRLASINRAKRASLIGNSGRPRSLSMSSDLPSTEKEGLEEPEWARDTAPKFFRSNDGSLGFEGRADERVLPAVARRLEEERRKEMEEKERSLKMGWTRDLEKEKEEKERKRGEFGELKGLQIGPDSPPPSPPFPSTVEKVDEVSPLPNTPPSTSTSPNVSGNKSKTHTPNTSSLGMRNRQSISVLDSRTQQEIWEAQWKQKEVEDKEKKMEKVKEEEHGGGCCKCVIM